MLPGDMLDVCAGAAAQFDGAAAAAGLAAGEAGTLGALAAATLTL